MASGSYDFPYDQAYRASGSLFPYDAIVSVASIQNTSDIYNMVISGYGGDEAYFVDTDGDMVCVFGTTNDASSFPSNSGYSYYDNYQAPFVLVLNSTNSTTFSEYLVAGDSYQVASVTGSCSAKTGIAYLVSGSGSLPAYRKGIYDYDVRLTFVNMTDGYQLSDLYFGAEGFDDTPAA
eukprot:CAMPEP_0168572782 /NCGR_PEP_ID=MMETSP0413-20121227/18155_1 /TAXON_ID=136452 /ORGANISM="Filamoeba nolandi, Strain NC-AS-23-1" /LENGTH=177 /DNA_ID=CAMNT_0008605929 /DNA_START=110 /DNA_END=639 /DNA_ORIENTATION=+